MTLDNRPLTAPAASEQQASLASLPEDLWRKIASLARPPTVRALVVACSDASLRSALRTDIDRAERAAFGLTQREAERSLVDGFRLIQANATRQEASAAFIAHIEDRITSYSDYYGDSPYVNPDYTMEIARMFLALGVDPDYVGDPGMTALMRIPTLAHQRYEEAQALAELLLTAGADPNKTDEHGLTPLALAYAELPAVLESPFGFDHRAATLCANLIPLFVQQSCRVLQYPSGKVDTDDDIAIVHAHTLTQQAAHASFFGGKTFLGATTQYLEYFDSHANIPGGNEFISLMFNLHILTRQLLPEQAAADGEDDQASGGDDANGN